MNERIPTSVLTIMDASQVKGEKLTTLKCRMTGEVKAFTKAIIFPGETELQIKDLIHIDGDIYNW